METAGFILAGGESSRMGRDKALLPWNGASLLHHVAAQVRKAAGSVIVIAPPGRYEHLNLSTIPDRKPGLGPLGGIHTALLHTNAVWNLIVACDMPNLTAEFLLRLIETARTAAADACLPLPAPGQPEPLCAVYQRRCAPTIGAALAQGTRKITAALESLDLHYWPVPHQHWFVNLNSPQDCESLTHE